MTNYQAEYAGKRTTAEEIAGHVKSGWNCCTDIAAAIPPALMKALGNRVTEKGLSGVTLHTMLALTQMPCYTGELAGQLTGVSWFSDGGARKAVTRGFADVMPCYYRDMPSLFRDYVEIDAFFAAVSPMDKHGYFTTGATGSNSIEQIKKAGHIFLEVNQNMPRALTAPLIHISQVTALCENNAPLPILSPAVIDDISGTIGGLIAAEVPDGATLQLGIGAVPEAVGLALRDKRDLGIHTELFTDSMVELIECGAVTNEKKSIHTGKTVATLAFGSQRLYDFIDDNPAFEMLPVSYVNDPAVISRHTNFISVNSALEVDFYGQVCAESVGIRHVSGTGGQSDYVRGAVMSSGGKSFIAFPSTAQSGDVSRICPTLAPGAIVSTSKNDVDYIVTEYGLAKLRGKTLSQRAKALIAIAHPKFRDELVFSAREQNIIL